MQTQAGQQFSHADGYYLHGSGGVDHYCAISFVRTFFRCWKHFFPIISGASKPDDAFTSTVYGTPHMLAYTVSMVRLCRACMINMS